MGARTVLLDWGYRTLMRPVLFRVGGGNPEAAHAFTIKAMSGIGSTLPARVAMRALVSRPRSPVTVAGIRFPGPVGLAAGVDKNGEAARGWAALGFGHIELGTVTALAQPGNPSPRMFRLRHSRALMNRMGFNNDGSAALAKRLQELGVQRGRMRLGCPVGVSIGKSKVTPLAEAVDDYATSARRLAPHADYLAINVSSPNTPGLRELQQPRFLAELLDALGEAADGVPVMVKLAPDLSAAELDATLEVCSQHPCAGLIVCNTTVGRGGLAPADDARMRHEPGGLSGAPLTLLARAMVRRVSQRSSLPLIGVGGIMSADDAERLLDLGASLVQVYSGFVFEGPALVAAINERR